MAEKGNRNALKHGAAAGEKALEKSRPLTGPAASAQLSVQADYAVGGAAVMIQEQAERLHAVSRLYFDAFLSAIQAGQLDKADNFAARFGWLANSSVRAWDTVKKGDKSKGSKLSEVLDSYAQARTQEGTGTAERSATVESGTKHGETEAT
jgi:hypothetical protein